MNFEKQLNTSISYQITSKNKKKNLSLLYQYSAINSAIENDSYIKKQNEDITSNQENNINNGKWFEHTFQSNYKFPILYNGKIDCGGKYILRSNINEGTISNKDSKSVFTVENSNFTYNQEIISLFSNIIYKIKKIDFDIGLRVEYATNDAIVKKNDTLKSKFLNTFMDYAPALALTYAMDDTKTISLSYTKKIKRPGIWHLDPFIDKTNPNNYVSGNSSIKPEQYHQIESNFAYYGMQLDLQLNIFSKIYANCIIENSKLMSSETVLTTYSNHGKSNEFGVSPSLTLHFSKNILFSLNTTILNKKMINKSNNESISDWGYDFFSNLEYRHHSNWKFLLSAYYIRIPRDLQSQLPSLYNAELNIKKELLKKSLMLSFSLSTTFGKNTIMDYKLYEKSFYQQIKEIRSGYSFGFKITYNWGNIKNSLKKVDSEILNDDIKSKGKR